MAGRCPFCWDQKNRRIGSVVMNGTGRAKILQECLACEKWYLQDTGEEVTELAQLCLNFIRKPDNCRVAEVLPARSGRVWSPKTKIKEFNHICSECSHKRFILQG